MEDDAPSSSLSRDPDDWLVHGLPAQPPSLKNKYATFYSPDHCYASWLPNGICVVGLVSSHPLLSSLRAKQPMSMMSETVSEAPEGRKRKREDEEEEQAPPSGSSSITIDFDVGKKNGQFGSRVDLKESGKKAGQGLLLQPGSLLAKISIDGGPGQQSCTIIRSPIAGKLLECNGTLIKTPSLLWEAPEREGHIAVFYPSAAETARAKEKLLTKEAYDALILKSNEGRDQG